MDMSPKMCWDCSATFPEATVVLLLGLVLLGCGVWLCTRRFFVLRLSGIVMGGLAAVWLLLSAISAFRNGVAWEDPMGVASPMATFLFFVLPLIFLIAVVVKLWDWASSAV
jgi:hypothetical protein